MSEAHGVELKPCPFCGGTSIKNWFIRDGKEVGCGSCGAVVHAHSPDALKKASEKWNRRKGETDDRTK